MIAWTTIGGFMTVFNSVIDTIFFCKHMPGRLILSDSYHSLSMVFPIGFLVDEDANKSDMRAPDKLKRLIQENKDASQKEFDDLSKVSLLSSLISCMPISVLTLLLMIS
jgi:hypothetical protein